MVEVTPPVSRRGDREGRTVPVMLEDGTYDVLVVDAEATGDGGALRLDVTILAGPHKGEVVGLTAAGLDVSDVDALGMPGTLTVSAGEPTLAIDR